VEPACGAALAAVYFSTETLERVLSSVVNALYVFPFLYLSLLNLLQVAEKASAVGSSFLNINSYCVICCFKKNAIFFIIDMLHIRDAQKPLRVVVIVCGGSGISLPLLAKYRFICS
jgi:hypothetical protein